MADQASSATSFKRVCSRRSTKGQLRPHYKRRVGPPYSYTKMIAMAIKSSPQCMMTLRDISQFLYDKFECFHGEYNGWRNSVRHTLSVSESFTKVLRDPTQRFAKDNYWTISENSEHLQNDIIDNEDTCKRTIVTSKRPAIRSMSVSSASSETTSDVSCESLSIDNQTNRLYHTPTDTTTYQPQSPETFYYGGGYYDQHYGAHHTTRRQHRYHPYTPHTNYQQQQECYQEAAQQQADYFDDLATIEGLFVPATDIDVSMMYKKAEPREQQHGLVPNPNATFDSNYQNYSASYLPTPYQHSHQHHANQSVSPPVDMSACAYPSSHPYGFTATETQHHEFPSTSSSVNSPLSSVSYESDDSVFLPSDALAVLYDMLV